MTVSKPSTETTYMKLLIAERERRFCVRAKGTSKGERVYFGFANFPRSKRVRSRGLRSPCQQALWSDEQIQFVETPITLSN